MSRSDAPKRSGGVDFPTLIVTALASATAAYVTSQIWTPGTLAAAAFTPVLVALLKEAYFKPVEVVTRAVPVRGVVRSAPGPGQPDDARETPPTVEERIPQLGEAAGVSRPGRARRNWQIAIVTGLLGFVIAAVIITVPELVAGGSASGGGRDTTFFGGGRDSADDDPADTSTTPTEDGDETDDGTDTPTVTVPEAETITVPPAETTPSPAEPPPPPEEKSPEVPAAPGSPPAPPG